MPEKSKDKAADPALEPTVLDGKPETAAVDTQENPEAPPSEIAADPDVDAPLVIDTLAEEEPEPPKRRTFGAVLAAETKAAFVRGDMATHAAIHNFEMAAGDFKRAAQAVVGNLPPESELRQAVTAIISDL